MSSTFMLSNVYCGIWILFILIIYCYRVKNKSWKKDNKKCHCPDLQPLFFFFVINKENADAATHTYTALHTPEHRTTNKPNTLNKKQVDKERCEDGCDILLFIAAFPTSSYTPKQPYTRKTKYYHTIHTTRYHKTQVVNVLDTSIS